MKKAVALFLTLIFISSVMVIIAGIFAIYQKFSQDNFYRDISQNSMLIQNVKSVLDNLSKDINGSDIKMMFNTFPVSSKEGDFRALISIKPLFDRVNINNVDTKSGKKYLENILEYYQVADPLFFENLLFDSLDLDKKERIGGTEIVLKEPFFKQGVIYSYEHFKEILEYYSKFMQDESIYKIPWRKLFFFENIKNSTIDCNLISKDVGKFLGLQVSDDINCKSLETFEENKKIMQKLSIIPFNKKMSYFIKVNILYNDENLSFIYDINKKRIKNIKSNILY